MYPYNTKYGRGLYSSTYPVSQKQPDLYLFLYSNDRINNGNLISKKSEMIKAINMKSQTCRPGKKSDMEMGGRGKGDNDGGC
jgi:hypothetical protein